MDSKSETRLKHMASHSLQLIFNSIDVWLSVASNVFEAGTNSFNRTAFVQRQLSAKRQKRLDHLDSVRAAEAG